MKQVFSMVLSNYWIKKSSFLRHNKVILGSVALQILKTNIEQLMIEKLTKTNTRGIVGNKSNKNSSNRMDL